VNRLRRLLGDLEGYLQKLTARERNLVALAAAGFAIFIVFMIGLGFSTAIHRRQSAVESKTKALAQLGSLASTYAERARIRTQLEQRLKNPVRLFTYIDEIAKKQGVDIGDMQDRGSVVGSDKITESLVEFDLNKMTLDRLTQFLNAIEQNPQMVKIKKIRVRTRLDDPNAVDAALTVAAYSLGST
jgi:type II secretory pathway component PulM